MKKIFLIMTLFLVICVNILASPLDFFKSYPNGSIKLDIKWENNKLYYNSYFYNASYDEINPKKNWNDFKTIGLLSDIHNTLNKNYSNKNMTASISLSILEKDKLTITSKYYNSDNIIQKEIVEDKFVIKIKNYDEYGNLLGETEKNEKNNTYYVKTYDKNLKSYTEMEVLFNKNEINFKGKKNLGNNVSDSYVMESHYVIKNLNQKNLKKILSNLSSNNYEDVINGYEKIYDNSYSFKYKEKTYKNGKLIDTKEYDSSNINADTFKNISKNEVQNSNNSYKSNENNNYNTINKTNNEKENLDDDKSSKDEKGNLLYVLFISIILILSLIAIIYEFFFKKNKKNKKKKLKYFEYIDLGDRKAVRYKGNLLNSSINYKILCNRKNILLFINYKNGSPTNIKFSVSNYYIDIDVKKLTNNLEAKIDCYIGTYKIFTANGEFKFLDWMYGNMDPKNEIDNFVENEKEVLYYLESFSYLENIFSPMLSMETLKFEEFLNFIILDGTIEEYYKNGKILMRTPFKNTLKSGKMEAFYESGKIKIEIPYSRGVVDGIAKEYFESGRLAKEIHYKDGKEMFYKSYFDNDKKQEKEKYSNGYSKDNPNRYYAILGVSKNITKDELKKVYYKLIKKYHPDKFENSSKKEKEKAENMMKDINEAYEYLMKNFI
ncbi:DnaJ domain-containing protein [Fusobacterium pseudoperiodonticum]|uniref:Molecular chaperone DnaJ n=1 Tax=Fusobacterium pseudoperiodonticum TaxID=2663009 RepID=A0A2D3NU39_9FUSO|nr:DnaJ domain-containing protein [Fusobacterium pseudoperiodonticum]ATV58892.1 molecular chaperone DnaJ [Fusobacterium pseudoperiodonticum]